ncbi:hypothetical protein B5E65_02060 [Gemmiger sp. An120]|nr:hypothetical protein B5E65_02060 [Gemmiger sp. An120]
MRRNDVGRKLKRSGRSVSHRWKNNALQKQKPRAKEKSNMLENLKLKKNAKKPFGNVQKKKSMRLSMMIKSILSAIQRASAGLDVSIVDRFSLKTTL